MKTKWHAYRTEPPPENVVVWAARGPLHGPLKSIMPVGPIVRLGTVCYYMGGLYRSTPPAIHTCPVRGVVWRWIGGGTGAPKVEEYLKISGV